MKADRKSLIALAVGWCVLFFVLISMTGNAIGTFGTAYSIFRSARFSFVEFAIVSIPSFVLLILLLVFLLRAWLLVIRLTRVLVRFIFIEESASTDGDVSDKRLSTELLFRLFGKNVNKLNSGLFWSTLRSFVIILILIILLTLIGGFLDSGFLGGF